MSWLTDIIKGELTAEAEQQQSTAGSAADLKETIREVIREELKTAVVEELSALKAAEQPKQEAPEEQQPKQEAPAVDIKTEIKKALAESLNAIPAKERSIEESYERVFNS